MRPLQYELSLTFQWLPHSSHFPWYTLQCGIWLPVVLLGMSVHQEEQLYFQTEAAWDEILTFLCK